MPLTAPTAMQMQRQTHQQLLTPRRHSRRLLRQPQRSLLGLHLLQRMQSMSMAPRLALLMHRTLQPWSAPASCRPLPPPCKLCQQTRTHSRLHMNLPQLQAQPVQPMPRRSQQLRLALQAFRPHSRRATAQQPPSAKPRPAQPRPTLLLSLLR